MDSQVIAYKKSNMAWLNLEAIESTNDGIRYVAPAHEMLTWKHQGLQDTTPFKGLSTQQFSLPNIVRKGRTVSTTKPDPTPVSSRDKANVDSAKGLEGTPRKESLGMIDVKQNFRGIVQPD